MPMFGRTTLGLAVVIGGALLSAACGGGSSSSRTATPATPRAAVTAGATTPSTPRARVTAGATTSTTPAAGGAMATQLTVTGKDLKDHPTALQANAGNVSITFDNEDAGIPHNFHLFRGKDASGASVGMTTISPGPNKQTLAENLAPGMYYYQCDVHPTTMHGTLIVS
ncbi:MAG: hypothetical protein EPO22_09425 [Dehalococcoidia bacterium]|nr:MAG: hypothetical protein EPO22_09425 [Dehalococcoidia bacterium]